MEEIVTKVNRYGIDHILMGLGVLFVCLLITRMMMKLVNKALDRMSGINPALHSMIRTMIRFGLYFISIAVSADVVGISLTSFVALFSLVGLAVSLAIQGVLNNLAGGIIILASRPFTLKDYIESEGISGEVMEIGFLHTKLRSFDGKLIFVPNSTLHTSRLVNHTASGMRRVDVDVAASYDNSPEEVRRAILAAIAAVPGVKEDPAPLVIVTDYGDNAINYRALLWTTWDSYYTVKNGVMEQLYTAFRDNGVEMTYPHINVHMN